MKYTQLTDKERYHIEILIQEGYVSLRIIFDFTGRDKSTISRELRRNKNAEGQYISDEAIILTRKRRKRKSRNKAGGKLETHAEKFKKSIKKCDLASPEEFARANEPYPNDSRMPADGLERYNNELRKMEEEKKPKVIPKSEYEIGVEQAHKNVEDFRNYLLEKKQKREKNLPTKSEEQIEYEKYHGINSIFQNSGHPEWMDLYLKIKAENCWEVKRGILMRYFVNDTDGLAEFLHIMPTWSL